MIAVDFVAPGRAAAFVALLVTMGLAAARGLLGPPGLNSLPCVIGLTNPGFFLGAGLDWLVGASPLATETVELLYTSSRCTVSSFLNVIVAILSFFLRNCRALSTRHGLRGTKPLRVLALGSDYRHVLPRFPGLEQESAQQSSCPIGIDIPLPPAYARALRLNLTGSAIRPKTSILASARMELKVEMQKLQ